MLVGNKTRNIMAWTETKRRAGRGAIAAALIGTFIVPATSMQAYACPTVGGTNMSKSEISIEVRRLQTNLMVAALSCGARADYNEFVVTHRPSLKQHGTTIRNEFRRRHGREGPKQLNRFVTRLANEASARSNADRQAFCSDATVLFQQARVQGMTVARMVTAPSTGTQLASAACDGKAASGYQSVSEGAKR